MFSIFKIEAGEIKPIVIAGHNLATVKDYEEELWHIMDEQLEYEFEQKCDSGEFEGKLYCLDIDIEEVYLMEEETEESDDLSTCVFYNEKYYTLKCL